MNYTWLLAVNKLEEKCTCILPSGFIPKMSWLEDQERYWIHQTNLKDRDSSGWIQGSVSGGHLQHLENLLATIQVTEKI